MDNDTRSLLNEIENIPIDGDMAECLSRMESAFSRHGYRATFDGDTEEIAIIRLDAMGDMTLTTGFIREVRKNFPRMRITLIVSPAAYSLVELCPYANEVLSFSPPMNGEDLNQFWRRAADFCAEHLWRKHLSLALCPQWGDTKTVTFMLSFMSGAIVRVGFEQCIEEMYLPDGSFPEKERTPQQTKDMLNAWLTHIIVTPKDLIHEVDRCLFMLTSIGLSVTDKSTEAWLSHDEIQRAKKLTGNNPGNKKIISLGIGSSKKNCRYPVEKYAAAINAIKGDILILALGGDDVRDDAAKLAKLIPAGKIIPLAGKATVRETMAAISLSDIYIGNDTGLMHMAAAMGKPVVELLMEAKDKENFLPEIYSSYKRFHPWGTRSIVLRPEHAMGECARPNLAAAGCIANEPHCITQIDPAEIVRAYDELMR